MIVLPFPSYCSPSSFVPIIESTDSGISPAQIEGAPFGSDGNGTASSLEMMIAIIGSNKENCPPTAFSLALCRDYLIRVKMAGQGTSLCPCLAGRHRPSMALSPGTKVLYILAWIFRLKIRYQVDHKTFDKRLDDAVVTCLVSPRPRPAAVRPQSSIQLHKLQSWLRLRHHNLPPGLVLVVHDVKRLVELPAGLDVSDAPPHMGAA
ncbi:hypothetical protein QBC33DRAFT_182561 [Phialemonium atrogriseum]|uniref:Uncharacterized protein n=1 Tax=Phialemonium atrogriseum TaxID=1093897 RepID=A0AAJ0FIU7_9PEZI|nr:uncharacterized protein QBC33DRAFT_182561 [Phialemonium atrogriseum]KAK1764758.1 hypothetical protein QBC33DRAFT_182561 [Phialemonium atrogriseum]